MLDPSFVIRDEVCDAEPQQPGADPLRWRVGSRMCELIGPLPGNGAAMLFVQWSPAAPRPGELSSDEHAQYLAGRDLAMQHLATDIDAVLTHGRALH